MLRLSRLFTILALTLLITLPAFAQTAFPPLAGHLIDGTERVDSARLEASVDPLVKMAAIPLAIVYNSTEGMGNIAYDAAVLQNYGYGVPAVALPAYPGAAPLDLNVIALSIDYEGRNMMVYVGDRFAGQIGQGGINAILDEMAKYAADDPTRAFEAGFAKAYDLLDPPLNRGVRNFVAVVLPIIPYILGGLLLIVLAVWFFRQMGKLSRARHEIRLVLAGWNQLVDAYGGGKRFLTTVVDLLKDDYAAEATRWTESSRAPTEIMNGLDHELSRLAAVKLGLFSPDSRIRQTVAAYQAAFERFEEVNDWVVSVTAEAKRLEDQVAGARDLLFRIDPEINRVRGWYEQAVANSRGTLPPKERVFSGLEAELESARQLVLYQSHGELRGARILEGIRVLLEALERAASLLVEVETHGINTMRAVRDGLAKWQAEIPSIESLSAAPIAHLEMARAELTDDRNYDDVVAPANAAKAGFDALRQAGADLAATLTLRDDVAASLEPYFARGYRREHVAEQLRSASEALATAINAIRDGEWQKAVNSLTVSRTASEQARKKLVGLVELQSTNRDRLAELSRKVAVGETYRTGEAGSAWEALQAEFARANWAPIADNFSLATDILADLFDNPSDASDLASQVERLNGMEQQDFTGAERLLNELFRSYQQALGLLEAIVARHALCVKARDTHEAAIAGAKSRIEAVDTYRDEHDTDVDIAVDEAIEDAEAMLLKARQAARERNFVLALEQADLAAAEAIRALDSAKGQVSRLGQLRQSLDAARAETIAQVEEANRAIGGTNDSIVQEATERALRSAMNALDEARRAEAGTAALEDRKLAEALGRAINAYESAKKLAAAAKSALADDKASYSRLLEDAQTAVSSAQAAIRRNWHVSARPSGPGNGHSKPPGVRPRPPPSPTAQAGASPGACATPAASAAAGSSRVLKVTTKGGGQPPPFHIYLSLS